MILEQNIISIGINYPELMKEISAYNAYFVDELSVMILDYYAKTSAFDFFIMCSDLSGRVNPEKLIAVKNLEHYEGNLQAYLNKLYTEYLKRRLVNYSNSLIHDSTITHEDIKIEIDKISKESGYEDDSTITDSKTACLDVLKNLGIGKIYSGVEFFDKFDGGIDQTDYIIIAARPSIGKTSYGINIIKKLLMKDKSVGFFSAEMTTRQIFKILAANIGGADLSQVKADDPDCKDSLALSKGLQWLYEHNLYIDDKTRYIEQLSSRAKKMKRKHGIEYLFIDYIQYIRTYDKKKNVVESLEYISNELKALTKELEIPIFALAQLNRETNDERPKMSDIKGCGSIEQDADRIILLQKLQQNGLIRDMRFLVDKNRNGATGSYNMSFDLIYRRFANERY